MIGPPANFQHLNHIGSGEPGGASVSKVFDTMVFSFSD